MKPILLRMQAFGPYAGEQTIDFSRLRGKNFFLISGPTGSGKTTILDAMVFALYGTSSGVLREGKSMRSDYAPADHPTEVEFIFSMGKTEFKIQRSPEQEIKKKRGVGTHKLSGSVALSKKNAQEEWDAISSKNDEVSDYIEKLIGFKADQFTQIVLLPQGEFRKFLMADSRDRQKILEIIFRTNFYSRLEDALFDKSKNLLNEYQSVKKEQDFYLTSCKCCTLEDLNSKIERSENRFRHFAEQAEKLKQQLTSAQTEWDTAKTIARLFAEKNEAEHNAFLLTQQSKQFTSLEENIRRAEEALPLNSHYINAVSAWKTLQQQEQIQQEAAAKNNRSREQLEILQKQLTDTFLGLTLLEGNTPDPLNGKPPLPLKELTDCLDKKIAALAMQAAALSAADNELIRLARSLKDGRPCPVCGALEHPRPADIEAVHRSQLQKEIASKQKTVDSLRVLQKKLQEAQRESDIAQNTLNMASSLLPDLKKTFLKYKDIYEDALKNSSFQSSDDFVKAKKKIPDLEKLRRSIRDYRDKKAAASERLQRAAAAVAGLALPNTVDLEVIVKNLTIERDHALQQISLQKKEVETLQEAKSSILRLQTKLEKTEKEYQATAYLSQYAKGDNPYKLTLSAYVLQTFLDDVLLQANERLKTMSRGRYLLNRGTRILDARKKSGLDLEINDAYTGQNRPVKTLSGGETFLASLALALGLTDVVQSYAGGIRLDTIFIDEGFGTLDPEALETAINSLIELQSNGRLVGIISHVAELQERIDARLEIIPGENGSTAIWHV